MKVNEIGDGVLDVVDERPVPHDALPVAVTPEWLEERMTRLMVGMQADLVLSFDEVLRRRLASDNNSRSVLPVDSDLMRQMIVYSKPILTMQEAAEMLGVSVKRLVNIIYEEKARLGRLPDFVCDAGGTIQRHIIKDAFVEWAKRTKKRRGRPFRRV